MVDHLCKRIYWSLDDVIVTKARIIAEGFNRVRRSKLSATLRPLLSFLSVLALGLSCTGALAPPLEALLLKYNHICDSFFFVGNWHHLSTDSTTLRTTNTYTAALFTNICTQKLCPTCDG